MRTAREKFLPLAKYVLRKRGIAYNKVTPLSGGKKGLVYLVQCDNSNWVLKLYRNPYKYIKIKKILRVVNFSKILIFPEILDYGVFWNLKGFCGFVIERFAYPIDNYDIYLLEDFFIRLSEFHRSTAEKREEKALGFWLKALKDTKSRWSFCKERENLSSLLEDKVFEMLHDFLPNWSIFSLCHTDIALSNAGLIDGKIVLFDWDRAEFLPPQFDLVQAIFSFNIIEQEETILSLYFENFFSEKSEQKGEEFKRSYLFTKVFFLVKRMKRSLKRKDKQAFSMYLSHLQRLVDYNS